MSRSYVAHRRSVAALAATALAVLAVVPTAAEAADTDTSFTITEGTGLLNISVPGTSDLGSVAFGGDLQGTFGTVTVTDQRSALYKSWSVSAKATDFTATVEGAEGPEIATASASDMTYDPQATSIVNNLGTGLGVPTPTTLGGNGGTVMSFTGGLLILTGDASWTPTIQFDTVEDGAQLPPGTYSGTVTHSLLG